MVRIACPFSHTVLFDACVVTQFRLNLEEELSVEINKHILEYVSRQQVFWLSIARVISVIHSRRMFRHEGMGLILQCRSDAAWIWTRGAFKNWQSHEIIRKFSIRKSFNASAIRLLTWQKFILGFIPR